MITNDFLYKLENLKTIAIEIIKNLYYFRNIQKLYNIL